MKLGDSSLGGNFSVGWRLVLLVDQSRAQRRALAVQLRRAGYDTIEAARVDEALHICTSQRPDIVILDWGTPGRKSPDFCRRFREMAKKRYGYFILLTSRTDKLDIVEGLREREAVIERDPREARRWRVTRRGLWSCLIRRDRTASGGGRPVVHHLGRHNRNRKPAWRTSGGDGFEAILRTNAMLRGNALLESICWSTASFAAGQRNDDISAVLIEHMPFDERAT